MQLEGKVAFITGPVRRKGSTQLSGLQIKPRRSVAVDICDGSTLLMRSLRSDQSLRESSART
ncbi:hypothetical protein AWC25_11570 [Mycobacterium sherrisii]|uniref:Uncharacterized protein n=1 Tax=Mycobacterium sherrisii TaxID=243061 RepID=A0A1E3SCF1_9MYCO|nr:hypothetical protein BHQ21_24925 [Mycobacterium sherrisii]ORW76764.1 hypothetical protein AWC25_11570 [Mycobacterium sherrisii]